MSVVSRHEGCLPPSRAADWLDRADRALSRAARQAGPEADFIPTASSLRLTAWAELPWAELWAALADTPPVQAARRALEGPMAVCASQSWLRRQYPPQLAPALHAPHQWHQDGALGWRFDLARPQATPPPEALLPMQTLWIALTDCGQAAPGLQWLPPGETAEVGLWPLADLSDAGVQRRRPGVRPESARLAAGDALRFDGALLHRTQPALGMTRVRTSLELRLFRADAIPPRLAGEQWSVVTAAA